MAPMSNRKQFKVAAIIAFLYCIYIVYQTEVAYNFQEVVVDLVTTPSVHDREDNITLDDLFVSVKTTKYYENTRLPIILKTWYQLAKEQIWFFTDGYNKVLQTQTSGHMVNTKCPASHSKKALCCKMAVEYDRYLETNKKWFCHFDDDNYVNIPRLVEVLQKYDYKQDWYLGRTSKTKPVQYYEYSFWFGTGGAGVCLSRSLALRMSRFATGGRFVSLCEQVQISDDVALGYLIGCIMHINLTVILEFHSHLEQMKLLDTEKLKEQVTFSYSRSKNEWNVVKVPGFDTLYDPTRFLSLHCFLFPYFNFCPR